MQDCFAFSDDSPWGRCVAQFLKTRQQYAPILGYYLSHPAKMPDDYTQEDVHAFVNAPGHGNRNRGRAPAVATSNQRLAVLKSFYSFSATYTIEGTDGHPVRILTTVPPTLGMKGGKPHVEYRALSFEEMERLFAVIPTDTPRGLRDRAIFLTYFWTARRRNEIARLLWGDIEQAILIDKEERREGWVYRWQGKGHTAKDDLAELPLPAKKAIDAYLMASGRIHAIQPNAPLFVSIPLNRGLQYDQSRPLDDETMARRLKFYCKKAGLDTKRITLHSWRHTASRERYLAGSSIEEVQRLLRHANISTTFLYLRQLTATVDPGASRLYSKFGHF